MQSAHRLPSAAEQDLISRFVEAIGGDDIAEARRLNDEICRGLSAEWGVPFDPEFARVTFRKVCAEAHGIYVE